MQWYQLTRAPRRFKAVDVKDHMMTKRNAKNNSPASFGIMSILGPILLIGMTGGIIIVAKVGVAGGFSFSVDQDIWIFASGLSSLFALGFIVAAVYLIKKNKARALSERRDGFSSARLTAFRASRFAGHSNRP